MTGKQRVIRADAKGRIYIGTQYAGRQFEQHLDAANLILRPVADLPKHLSEQVDKFLSNPGTGVKRGRPSKYDVDTSEEL